MSPDLIDSHPKQFAFIFLRLRRRLDLAPGALRDVERLTDAKQDQAVVHRARRILEMLKELLTVG